MTSGKWGEMEILRKVVAVLLTSFGVSGAFAALAELVTGQEVAYHLATIPLAVGSGLSGWLLWRRAGRKRVGGALLLSVGAFALLMGMGELATGKETVIHLLMGELRFGLPALICGWLLWTRRPVRQIGAALVVSWAASFTIQAVVYADAPVTTIVLVTRAGIPGFLCAWLLWRGCELCQIGAVLLISWPLSYLIYVVRGEDLNNAIGELVVGVPTIAVGCLLWWERKPEALPAAPSVAAVPSVDAQNE